MFWGGSRSTKPCVFPCKVAAGDDERYLVCAAVAAGVGLPFFVCCRMLACCRAPTLETCCNAKWKRKEIWSRKTWGLTLASKKWQRSSIAWRLHCTSTTRCKIHGASRADEVSQPRTLRWLVRSLDNCLHGTRRYLGRTALRCPERWWCARCGHVVECLPSRCRMSFVASRCSLGPQCHCR